MGWTPHEFAGLIAAAGCSAAMAQPPSTYGIDFVRIGDPGNPGASPQEFPRLDAFGWGPIGSVNYEFFVSRTEMTVEQHLEYVRAYASVYPNPLGGQELTGMWIFPNSSSPGGYRAHPAVLNYPTNISWYHAARYCNWLTNGKVNESWAFETGAYDTRTWTDDVTIPHFGGQLTHTPGASFWLPSVDEWTKAMHWDPNKLGPGQGGYWRYPTSSDLPPVGGYPGTPGAQTGAGEYPGDAPRYFDVGSYPQTTSPWGLLDGSGGWNEWVEYASPNGIRWSRGNHNYSIITAFDSLDYLLAAFPTSPFGGVRIASSIPTPAGSFPVAIAFIFATLRRSR